MVLQRPICKGSNSTAQLANPRVGCFDFPEISSVYSKPHPWLRRDHRDLFQPELMWRYDLV